MPSFNFSITLVFLFITICFLFSLTSSTEDASSSYLYNFCFNTSTDTENSTYQANLNGLLSSLSSNAKRDSGFYSSIVGKNPDIAYGLFLCRGDLSADDCQNCVTTASTEIVRRCTSGQVAIIWYDDCMLRYSNQSIFSILATYPSVALLNTQNVTEPGRFDQLLRETVSELVDEQIGGKKYAAKPVDFNQFQTLYAFVQCTPELSFNDCRTCLTLASFQTLNFSSGKQGGRLLTPSCFVRYEIYPFYSLGWTAAGPSPSATRAVGPSPNITRVQGGGKAPWLAIGTSVSAFVVIVLLGSCIFYKCRRKRAEGNSDENQEIQLIEYFEGGRLADNYSNENLQGDEHAKSQDFPLICLGLINVATKNFSKENKLGEGGFGPVYKGTLVDGKEIAVKRLSKTSGQGLREFKTEVTLIAKLQHRNLVRLLGCCLEGQELLLVYEYMPNKSLDFFLFDSTRGAQLDWKTRLGIINGVARGLLYLHEDSRLRIIHRDLKVSNILLDHEMNPKISDFGMARIFGGNQNEANTNRVVGTYGYMAPEYAMEGLFSVKSDVFSFGVLLLEIISGKKNSGFHLSEHGESLLTFAWKLWSKGQGMELVDPFVVQSCVAIEVLKYIHIGLLCVQEDAADRPTMSYVVVMLGSETVTFPQPTQPAFSVGRVVTRSVESTSNNQVNSVNEVTLSNVLPR